MRDGREDVFFDGADMDDLMGEFEDDSAPKDVDAVGTPGLETLTQYGAELEMLKEEIERLDAEKKVLQERYDKLRKSTIPDLMHAAGIASDGKGSFTISTGSRISLRNDLFVHVLKEDESDRLFPWLRDNGLGDIIRETVHHSTLKATVREIIGGGRQIPDFIRVHYETAAVLTRGRRNS